MQHRRPVHLQQQQQQQLLNENETTPGTPSSSSSTQPLRRDVRHMDDDHDDDSDTKQLGKRTNSTHHNNRASRQQQWRRKVSLFWTHRSIAATGGMILCFVCFAAVAAAYYPNAVVEILSLQSWLQIMTLFPIYMCGYTCLRHISQNRQPQQEQQHNQQQLLLQKILLPSTVILTVIAAQLPPYVGAAIASTSIIAFSIVTRPAATVVRLCNSRNNDEQHQQQQHETGTGSAAAATTTTTTSVTSNNNNTTSNSSNNNNNSHQYRTSTVTFATVVLSMCCMIVVLLMENFLIWVVSATFVPGYISTTAPPPLQDNGQHVLNYIFHTILQVPTKATIVSLRRLLNTQWTLVAGVGTSFVITEVYHRRGRTLYGLANRALMTIAIARFIRTISFMITVVPSQNIHCYIQRGFPFPPPSQWLDWIWIGIIPRSHGGCNDLIVSGHATIISTLACISTSVSDDIVFAIALWSMVVMDFMIEIYEGFHYSVDMWLGIVLVTLLWNVLYSLEGLPPMSTSSSSSSNDDDDDASLIQNQKQHQEPLSIRSYVAYILPGLGAYMQLIVIPQEIANFVIVFYVSAAVFVYIQYASKEKTNTYLRQWYIHYAQHILLCLVFMALGIYL